MVALLLSLLLLGTGPGVFAQGQPSAEVFGWPLEEWQQQVEASMSDSEPPRSKMLPSAMVVRKGPASSGAVALTFDDGYDAKACASIAETLRRYGAVGTFFINGQWLTREPERWRRILEGMEVANHTRSHPRLTQAPHPVVINQIRTNEWIHERVLGRQMVKALRPPYGAHGERVGRIAKSLGYDYLVMWNVDTGDWKPRAKAKRIVRAATGAAPGSIILMHCAREATAKALPSIVRHYQRRGIEVAGLSRVLTGARPSKATSERYGG
jgi:peptidoglycan/xylan/chitin deacetylase (PgdA/CDA1 family)